MAVIGLLTSGIHSIPPNQRVSNITNRSVGKQPISFLLSSENLKLLTKNQDNKTKWNPKWQKFRSTHRADNTYTPAPPWGFKDWNNIKNSIDAPEEFKDLCKRNGSKEVFNENDLLYLNVKDFCSENK
ncbi:hypothetical protein [Candidatus Mycoplasma haematobovis]|nr:hypothetical protein [Candidatus Mycoplasma haematobovis]